MDVAVVTSAGGVVLVLVRESPAGLVDCWSGRLVDPVSVLWVGPLVVFAERCRSRVLCAA